MSAVRPVLVIINTDMEIKTTTKKCPTKIHFRRTHLKRKAYNKRHVGDRFSNLFDAEKNDSEVVGQYKKILKFIFLPTILMGVRLNYGWQPQRHLMMWFTMFNLAFAWCCFLYTQYVHISSENDKMKVFKVFALYGLGISCIVKGLNYLMRFKKVQALLEFMLNICRQNSTDKRADILKSQLRKLYSKLKVFAICVLGNLALFVSVPVVSYLLNQDLITLIPAIIPFVDQTTLHGYLTANCIMSVNGLLTACGTTFCACLYILLIFNFTMQIELIGDDIRNLDRMWADKKQSLGSKRAFLRDIFIRCQDSDNYIVAVKEIFDRKMFAFFCGAYFSQIFCLFEIAQNNWISGYSIALLLFQEMMYYCYIGTQKNNERLCSLICGTNWYEYDIQSQQVFMLLLLHSSQNRSELKIGPLAPMNLSTGIEILRSIYSYYAILKNIL
ncbi:odorant receptor 67d-like isoform X2 [Bradysia coprophila]|uniref:odorant receptor 67d-like isoform X2 n=1 Tax=Bradysia coprophila TaxID=38358 RepID=UPI00187DCD71|nr:odorant receptor 67d-like isoform X2 [Bradysia coprophila]